MQTTYSAVDVISPLGVFALGFFNSMSGLPAAPGPFPTGLAAPRAPLGKFMSRDFFDQEGRDAADDEALAGFENLRSFGFEAMKVRLDPSRNSTLLDPLEATVKVRHPAMFALLAAHGGEAPGDTNPSRAVVVVPGKVIDPERDLTLEDTASLKTLIFSSCNVLDLHDYNSNVFAPDVPLDRRVAYPGSASGPGQLWRRITGNGNTILLGYNYPVNAAAARLVAASSRPDGSTPSRYAEELVRLSGLVPPEELQQIAWISANLKVAREGGEGGLTENALNACAWDRNFYYYIAYAPGRTYRARFDEPRRVRGVYKIPLDNDGDNREILPTVPPAEPGGVPVTIP
ncbi:MAG: hypothetical protein AB1758_37020 [Candidatus Eremiobacterota bacterium]